MSDLKIASINVKDNATNRAGNAENAKKISNIIKDFDLIGTQEFTIKYINEVAQHLKNYKFYGSYRYGNLLVNMPYNENNNIITNQHVTENNTIWLPWVADNFKDLKTSITKMSIMPRIATIVIIKTKDEQEVCMINTHLDYQVPSIQIRQLNAIKDLIAKYGQNYPLIITGDFNMELGDKKFDAFVRDVKGKVQYVDINGKTWHGKNGEEKALDHIFVSNDFKIENAGIISSQGTSDHDVIYTSISRKH